MVYSAISVSVRKGAFNNAEKQVRIKSVTKILNKHMIQKVESYEQNIIETKQCIPCR